MTNTKLRTAIMAGKQGLSVEPHEEQMVKESKVKTDQLTMNHTEEIKSVPLLHDGENVIMTNETQLPKRNTVIMKNHLGEDMEMSLDFGPMRKGPPSTDGEDSEEEVEKTVTITKKVGSKTRYSDYKEYNFLRKKVMHSKEGEDTSEVDATQTEEATALEYFGRCMGSDHSEKT